MFLTKTNKKKQQQQSLLICFLNSTNAVALGEQRNGAKGLPNKFVQLFVVPLLALRCPVVTGF